MPEAFLVLLLFQLLGAGLQDLLHVPVPGPVIGMFLLAATLLWCKARAGRTANSVNGVPEVEVPVASPALSALSRSLIACLGLLFVPAGVGIVTQMSVLASNALPITASLFGSTLLGLLVTAWVMHRATRDAPAPERINDTGGQVL